MKTWQRVLSVLFVGILLLGVGCSSGSSPEQSPSDLLSLGEQYLLELDYEQALVQFLKVIEVEPMNPRGYTGAAEAYAGLGNEDGAADILQRGLEETGDADIQSLLDALVSPDDVMSVSSTTTSSSPLDNTPVNLTGKEPFTVKDLEDWGYPPGLTVWDVQDVFDLDIAAIEARLVSVKDGTYDSLSQYCLDNTVHININGEESIVSIFYDQHTDVLPDGPRGIYVGMLMQEVVDLFMLSNEDVYTIINHQAWQTLTGEIRIYDVDGSHARMKMGTRAEETMPMLYYYTDKSDYRYQHGYMLFLYFSNDGILKGINIQYEN